MSKLSMDVFYNVNVSYSCFFLFCIRLVELVELGEFN